MCNPTSPHYCWILATPQILNKSRTINAPLSYTYMLSIGYFCVRVQLGREEGPPGWSSRAAEGASACPGPRLLQPLLPLPACSPPYLPRSWPSSPVIHASVTHQLLRKLRPASATQQTRHAWGTAAHLCMQRGFEMKEGQRAGARKLHLASGGGVGGRRVSLPLGGRRLLCRRRALITSIF